MITRIFVVFMLTLLSGCGGDKVVETPTNGIQSEPDYGGRVELSNGVYTFTSHTSDTCGDESKCIRAEVWRIVSMPVAVSFDIEIAQWVDMDDEHLCGTFDGGKLRGCYVIISQFWNSTAGPRAYMTLSRKRTADGQLEPNVYTLLFQNKDDHGVVSTLTQFEVTDSFSVMVTNGENQSVSVNGSEFQFFREDTAGDSDEFFKFGMYWQRSIYDGIDADYLGKNIVLKFKNVEIN